MVQNDGVLTAIALLVLAQPTPPLAFLRQPDIYGDKVAFACEGDIWIADATTGKATRVTTLVGNESSPRFSPDGTQLSFVGSYEGLSEIYVMPSTGGTPRRVTYRNEWVASMGWTPDGKNVLFGGSGNPATYKLYSAPVAGGFPELLPLEFVSHASFAPDGTRFVFTRIGRAGASWFRYQGGQKNDIWVGDLAKKEFKKVHASTFTNEYPVWAGDKLCFVKDEGTGDFSAMSCKPDGSGLKRLAGPYDVEIRELHTDGKSLIYEKGVGIERLDLSTGKITPLLFELPSDKPHTQPFMVAAESFCTAANIGPTGKRVLAECRGQIVSLPAKEGDARIVLAKPGVRFTTPVLSRDAKQLAFVSDETGEQQVYIGNADGTKPVQITKDVNRQIRSIEWFPDGKSVVVADSNCNLRIISTDGAKDVVVGKGVGNDGPPHSISPDGKWIVYQEILPVTYFGRITFYEVATAKKTVVGDPLNDDMRPVFSSDGTWLAFLSPRTIAPKWDARLSQLDTMNITKVYVIPLRKDTPVPFAITDDEETPATDKKEDAKPLPFQIDFDGLYQRTFELPIASGNYDQLAVVGDRVIYGAEGNLSFYDLKAKKGGSVGQATSFQVSGDNKKLLLNPGAGMRIVDVTAENIGGGGDRVPFGNLQLTIVPPKEWEQIYWDSWRLLRDYFYVQNLHGADWPAIGKKYAQYLPAVRSRDELNELIRWLQSELTTGHMWLNGGDTRGLARRNSPAFLGIDVKPDPSGYYQIAKILRGDSFEMETRSPFDAPGVNVKEGEYLIEVAGMPAKLGVNFMQNLLNRAGQTVAVKVNDKPTEVGARTVHIKPLGSEWRLRYREWVRSNREYVDKASGGKVGYLHMNAMGEGDMADFIKQYFGQRDKEAIIIDDRFNGGGYISTTVIGVLKQKLVAYFNQRGQSEPWSRQGDFFPGPMVCMLNEFSGSNGEEFPHHFKALGLGPLVGRRTWGGEVGSGDGMPLIDGGRVYVPAYGAWTPKDGWVIESRGVSPDYDVESDPNAYARGRDAQLDKAAELLLDSLKKHPVVRPVQPPDPIRSKR